MPVLQEQGMLFVKSISKSRHQTKVAKLVGYPQSLHRIIAKRYGTVLSMTLQRKQAFYVACNDHPHTGKLKIHLLIHGLLMLVGIGQSGLEVLVALSSAMELSLQCMRSLVAMWPMS